MSPVVVLIGPMGAGKTKVGKRVAGMLGVGFTDTDKQIVAEHGPIAEIFDSYGEGAFRELERTAVREALATDGVVALGGGAVLAPETQEALAAHPVVLLTVTGEAVASRLGGDGGKRPLVRDGGVEAWSRIFEARRPVYERLARLTLDTSARPYDSIAREVADWSRAQRATA